METTDNEWLKIFDSLSIESEEINDVNANRNHNEKRDKTELTLCKYNFNELSNEFFQNFSNLVKLNISDSKIRELPNSIYELKKLERLIVDRNDIQQLSDAIIQLEVLNEFSIAENCLSALPSNMGKLNKLQILNLSDNKLMYLPKSWAKMNKLITLDISRNLFEQMPDCLQEGMLGIQSLNVSGNKHMKINGDIFSRNLKKFYANYNEVIDTSFPKWISSGKFSEMDELEFENTQFKLNNVPISNRKMSLKRLNLKNCKLYDAVLNKVLANLSSIEYLDIGNTKYTKTENSFSILPSKSIYNPQKLIEMSMCNTGLVDISKSIQFFTNLVRIDLHGNNLSWLPEEFCTLTKLEDLNISANIIIMLPQNLGSMNSLKVLNVANNYISSLPPSITNFQNLEWMDLFGNELTEFPEQIKSLPNLRALDLELNLFTTHDITLPVNYLDLRNQLRVENSNRSIGPRIINIDCESTITNFYFDECNILEENESVYQIIQDTNIVDETMDEENWDATDDFENDFDPFNPPPITLPKWKIPHDFFRNSFNFCPADLHAQKIKDVIAQAQTNGQYPSMSPIVEGQFDDIE